MIEKNFNETSLPKKIFCSCLYMEWKMLLMQITRTQAKRVCKDFDLTNMEM